MLLGLTYFPRRYRACANAGRNLNYQGLSSCALLSVSLL